MKTAGKIFKLLFHATSIIIVFGTIGVVLWRIFMLGTPNEMKYLVPNERLCSTYEENGGELTLYYQEQNTLTRGEENSGYFGAPHVTFIKEADQLQVVFRYNLSTLKHLKEDYSLALTPDRNGEYFDVTVSVSTDLTPDIAEDNSGNDPESVLQTRYYPTTCTTYQNSLYNYVKFVFDEICIEEDTLAVFLDIYYNEDIDYGEEPYGALCLYDFKSENVERKLTAQDIKLIENFVK